MIANLEASKQRDTEQPILYLRMQLAQYALVQVGRLAAEGSARLVDGNGAGSLRGWMLHEGLHVWVSRVTPLHKGAVQGRLPECKRMIEDGREELERLTDVRAVAAVSPGLLICRRSVEQACTVHGAVLPAPVSV